MTARPLRAFVSSTFIDLALHRAEVISALRKAGISVDPMEEWTAASDRPQDYSPQRVEGCDLCVLLVAWRRGHIPSSDNPEGLSITQLEYDAAVRQGTDVLVFLLDEGAAWPRHFDELDEDPAVREWRERLEANHGVGYFHHDPASVDIQPALTRWTANIARAAVKKPATVQRPQDAHQATADRVGHSRLPSRPHNNFAEFMERFSEIVALVVEERSGGGVPARLAETLNPEKGVGLGLDRPRLTKLVEDFSALAGTIRPKAERVRALKVGRTLEGALHHKYKNALHPFVLAVRELLPGGATFLLPGADLSALVPPPMDSGTCIWQVKESQVLTGEKPESAGYYPVLVGLELLLREMPDRFLQERNALIHWTLSDQNFDQETNWFKHSSGTREPADPPLFDIRHTAEVGIALLLDGRSTNRVPLILENIISKQGAGCPEGSWRWSDAAKTEDALSTVICAEFLARSASIADSTSKKEQLRNLIDRSMRYLDRAKGARGWPFGERTEGFWQPWGASIVGFRLRGWLPEHLQHHVRRSILEEIESTDTLLSFAEPQRVRLLARYLCALRAIQCDEPILDGWIALALASWEELDPSYRDVSTSLHLAHLVSSSR